MKQALYGFALRVARRAFRARWLLAGAAFCLFVGLELHGHSIGIWDDLVREKTEDYSYFCIGAQRRVRSDEWLIATPWSLAQTMTSPRFPAFNAGLYAHGMHMGLAAPGAPVLDVTAIGQFHNWGYFLFGASRGLAWNWWARYLGVFMLGLEFLLLVTGGQKFTALAGALSITLAAPTQWWDTTVPYHLLYFFGFLVAYWKFLNTRDALNTGLLMAACIVGLCSFFLTTYPAFQLPLLGLLVMVAICYQVSLARFPADKPHLIAIIIGICVTTWVLYVFVSDNAEGIRRIAATVYPGLNVYTGGSFASGPHLLWPLQSMFFAFRGPPILNASEMSLFLVPLPALAVAVPRLWRRATPGLARNVFRAFIVMGLILLSWCLFQFPVQVARWSLLFPIDPRRALVIATFSLHVASFLAVSLSRPGRLTGSIGLAGGVALLAVLLFLLHLFLQESVLLFFFARPRSWLGLPMVALAMTTFGTLNYSLLRGNARVYCGTILFYALLSGVAVHPLNRGLSPIQHKRLAEVCLDIHDRNPAARWIDVTGKTALSQYLTALGIPVVTGVHNIPDLDLWRQLDPEGLAQSQYNRYAHVSVRLSKQDPSFHARQADVLQCYLRPGDLRRISGLEYVLSRAALPTFAFELIASLPAENLRIYQLKNPASANQ
ncbi:MAG: hypothetical protein K9N49_06540 [Candidatus Marinimicrobia bacterium]|nr:hypothetical protein [Candidatus Neomarinimicrobiota bacterium]